MLSPMCLSNIRVPAGTIKAMSVLQDVVAGANVVCIKSKGGASKGKEYTVTAVSPQRVDFEARGSKFSLKPMDFLQCFERRLGPVVKDSIRRGLVAKATMDGKKYRVGDVVTLTEAGGTVFDFKDSNGQKGSVEKQELLTTFIYI